MRRDGDNVNLASCVIMLVLIYLGLSGVLCCVGYWLRCMLARSRAAVQTPVAPAPVAQATLVLPSPTPLEPLACVICFDCLADTRFAPCGHTCCLACAKRLQCKCPFCRERIAHLELTRMSWQPAELA